MNATQSADHPHLITIGEAMVLLVNDTLGPWQLGSQMHTMAAGAELNVALTAAGLGAPARWIGVLGDDVAADILLARLRAGGVDYQARRVTQPTGLIVRERRTALGSRVHYWRRHCAGAQLDSRDVEKVSFNRSSFLHLTGITPALSDTAAAAAQLAFHRARDAGSFISFDINYRHRLWSPERARRALAPFAAADVVIATQEEARMLLNQDPPAAQDASAIDDAASLARDLQTLGATEVIVKLGHRGAMMLTDAGELLHVSAPGVPVIDTVGAGDAFVGGLLASWMRGQAPASRLKCAVECGSWAVTVPGDSQAVPSPADLLDLTAEDADRR